MFVYVCKSREIIVVRNVIFDLCDQHYIGQKHVLILKNEGHICRSKYGKKEKEKKKKDYFNLCLEARQLILAILLGIIYLTNWG